MGFGVIDLFKLTLKRQTAPLIDGISGKLFPERIPASLIALCFINSLVKLLTPLILQQTYSSISSATTDTYHYLTLISIVIISIAISQFILIAYGLMLSLYTLNVKRQLSARILANNFQNYKSSLESPTPTQKSEGFNMELSIKISTKLSVYVHNYYESYLSLIFECLNIVVIFIYLLYKLSFSLFFGVAIAGCVMYKTIRTANLMQSIRFDNIARRARRLKILESFFARITQFKMSWLDKWIYDRITKIQNQFQQGLRKIKMLDCWCVALWQFTSVGISSIVITAYFLLGLNQKVDKDSVFTPSTFVYLLGMLNFPLNALSWYIAGIKTAHRAIQELQQDIKIQNTNAPLYQKIQSSEDCFIINEPIRLQFKQENTSEILNKIVQLPIKELPKGKIYSVNGVLAQQFMDKLVFLFEDKTCRGFVEQNSWLSSSPLQTFRMQQNLAHLEKYDKQQILKLMELFLCADIPLNTSTINYSGGQKLRISLVRAFHLGQVIIINTNLQSLDSKMQNTIKQTIRKLVDRSYTELKKQYTVFIRDNQDISDYVVNLIQKDNIISLVFKNNNELAIIKEEVQNIPLSPQILKFKQEFTLSFLKANQKMEGKKRRYSMQKFQQLDKMKQKSVVSWDTFKLYYKSKKHIAFIVSLLFVTFLSNYYNYYINTYIKLLQYNQHQVTVIIAITIIFAIGLYFRSFYFADANLDQSYRICHTLNKNIVMNELSFYNSEEIIQENTQSVNSKSKMICALTSDTETIADQFPFSTNIFANNITVIISSMIVIIIEVPPMIFIMIFLVIYANRLNKISHKKDQYLKIIMKEKDVDVYRTISELQNGRKYIIIHNKFKNYSEQYLNHQQQLFSIDWLSSKFKNYINLKYKTAMIIFLIIAVALYSIMKVFTSNLDEAQQNLNFQQSKQSSGLALLIQYTIQLSNYLLYFTMSIWQIKGQAISLKRIKPYIEQTKSIKDRISSADKIIKKLQNIHQQKSKETKIAHQHLLKIKDLNFAYQVNPNTLIFNNLNIQINKGDKIIIRGRSGSGKTTLYKLFSSAYPSIMSFVDSPFIIYFSPQHPLILPDTQSIQQNINPYAINSKNSGIEPLQHKYQLESHRLMKELNYEQKIIINNLRAFLYGGTGIIIYDQPQIVVEDIPQSTYIIVTHHRQFQHNIALELQNGSLVKK